MTKLYILSHNYRNLCAPRNLDCLHYNFREVTPTRNPSRNMCFGPERNRFNLMKDEHYFFQYYFSSGSADVNLRMKDFLKANISKGLNPIK